MMMKNYEVMVVTKAIKATLKKDKAAAVIGNQALNHRQYRQNLLSP